MRYLKNIGINSRKAFENLKKIDTKKVNLILEYFNKSLLNHKQEIIKENLKDLKNTKRKHLIDRLILNNSRIDGMRNSVNEIIKFKSPLGKVLEEWKRSNKLRIKKVSIPIGVIGVIYESRPNVTADVSALCLKSGNCAILRGGSEAINSNKIISDLFRESLRQNNVDNNCVQFIENTDRKIVDLMLSKMSNYIDVIVPRGGKSLVKKVQKFSNVNVIGHLEGLCHIYVDNFADLKMAIKLILNAKMRRTSICGAVETLLINEKVINTHAKPIIQSLIKAGCEIRADKKINKIFSNKLKKVKEIDWKTEYLDAKISVKVVKNVDEAVSHILKYGTMHTDGIITNNSKNAEIFLN